MTTFDRELLETIDRKAADIGLPSDLLFALASIEGAGAIDAEAEGDGGQSHGAFQAHIPAHGGTRADWIGIAGTVRIMDIMAPRWVSAFIRHGGLSVWRANPAGFLKAWMPDAQGSDEPTDAQVAMGLRVGREAAAWLAAERRADEAGTASDQGQGEGNMGTIMPPPITWRPAHPDHYGARAAGILPEAVVLHITDGGDPSGWFALSAAARGGSVGAAHFSVGRDGTVRQHVSLDNAAYAHGVTGEGSTAKLVRENTANPNDWAIGIEHDGRPGEQLTPAQFEASARLCAWLFADLILPRATTTGAAVDRDHVLMHADLQPKTRARCPGWGEAAQQVYIARVRGLLAEPAPTPEPVAVDVAQLRTDLVIVAAGLRDLAARAAVQADGVDALLARLSG